MHEKKSVPKILSEALIDDSKELKTLKLSDYRSRFVYTAVCGNTGNLLGLIELLGH